MNNQASRPQISLVAFTLIELLVVIAVISILAALIFPVTGAVNRNKIRSRARTELSQIEMAIENYKTALGHYPPDNPTYKTTNQLYYELLGTTLTNQVYTTLDGSASISQANLSSVFGFDASGKANVGGFVNCTKGAGGDEGPVAKAFLQGLKPLQVGNLTNNHNAKILIGYPWK